MLITYGDYRAMLEMYATKSAPSDLYYELHDNLATMSDRELIDFIHELGGKG